MSSLKTFSDIHDCLTAAVTTTREALETLEGTLPVATPDDLEHTAMHLTFAAAHLRKCAAARRKATTTAPQWWQ